MNIILGIIIGLLVLMLLVVMHELGHFLMARKSGIEVEEFGIGFTPRAVAWQKRDGKWRRIDRKDWGKPRGKGLVISLNFLPIGGFCKMKGESSADERKGSFGRASLWGKTKTLFGGVVANLVFSVVVLTVLAFTGMPHFVEGQFSVGGDTAVVAQPVVVSEVMKGGPADEAGLLAGDEIVKIGGETVVVQEDVAALNDKNAGREVELAYRRDGEDRVADVRLNEKGSEYLLGVMMSQKGMPLYRSTWSAPIVGVVTTAQLTGETFVGVGQLLFNFVSGVAMQVNFNSEVREHGADNLGQAGEAVSGPVGIVGYVFPMFASTGLTNIMFLAAIISISLAVMNVLPIPALDGGRWLLIIIYRLRKKKLTTEIEEKVVGRAFMALLALIVIITVIDITRFFR